MARICRLICVCLFLTMSSAAPIGAGITASRTLKEHLAAGEVIDPCQEGHFLYHIQPGNQRRCFRARPGMYIQNTDGDSDSIDWTDHDDVVHRDPQPCPPGKSHSLWGSYYASDCTSCGPNQYSINERWRVDCFVNERCHDNYGGLDKYCRFETSRCVDCPAGYISNAGEFDVDACAVRPGMINTPQDCDMYTRQSMQTCCGNHGSLLQNGGCPAAPYLKGTISPCTKCPAGKTRNAGETDCTNCPIGKYADESAKDTADRDTEICKACPVGETSPAGSDSETDCFDASAPQAKVYCFKGITQELTYFNAEDYGCDPGSALGRNYRVYGTISGSEWTRVTGFDAGGYGRVFTPNNPSCASNPVTDSSKAETGRKCYKNNRIDVNGHVKTISSNYYTPFSPGTEAVTTYFNNGEVRAGEQFSDNGAARPYEFHDFYTAETFVECEGFDEANKVVTDKCLSCMGANAGHVYAGCYCCAAPPGYISKNALYPTALARAQTVHRQDDATIYEGQIFAGRHHIIEPCPAGTYNPNTGQTSCTPCEAGKYQPETGQASCKLCENSIGTEVGATHSDACCVENSRVMNGKCVCSVGYYGVNPLNQYGNVDFCYQCPKEMTSQAGSMGLLSCSCPPGHGFSTLFAGCEECVAGKIQAGGAYSPCQDCQPGTYQENTGQTHCDVCAHGTYSSSTGRTEPCTPCEVGKIIGDAYCYSLVSGASPEVARIGPDITECKDTGADPYHCHIPECVDEESDCQLCEIGKTSSGGAEMCSLCDNGKGNDVEGGLCEPCEAGKYAEQSQTSGQCQPCNEHHRAPNPETVTCTSCERGKTNSEDRTSCVSCDLGFFQIGELDSLGANRLTSLPATYDDYGCFGCNHDKQSNSYMDANDRSCKQCPAGKFTVEDSGILGVDACQPCDECNPQEYRTECGLIGGVVQSGRCEPCGTCGAGETRIGCIHQQGHNDKSGRCEKTEFVTRTPLCPDHEKTEDGEITGTSQFGLGGFMFTEVFGVDENHTDFQCRRPCDGTFYGGTKDTGFCAGPFPCNRPSCSMQSDDSTAGLTNLEARGCPVQIESGDTDNQIRTKLRAECQSCADCQGRGCARECSQLRCQVGMIWDFSETFLLDKCKFCSELQSPELCQEGFVRNHLQLKDVSGNRPKFFFTDCQPKRSVNTYIDDESTQLSKVSYGQCQICLDEQYQCPETDQYHVSCNPEILCQKCHRHGSMPLTSSTYTDENAATGILYCQVEACTDGDKTGVTENGVMCSQACDPTIACAESEEELPCLLPHQKRCVEPRPKARSGQIKKGVIPVHANILESVSDPPHLALNFENILMPLIALPEHLHQCVWNARIFDNDMNPGGISHSFLRPDATYETDAMADGAKFCNAWTDRDMNLQYPLLPLQNTVTDGNAAIQRRVLVNTSARAMHYDYTGEGHEFEDHPVLDVSPRPRLATEFTGDFFLNLDVTRARRVTMAAFIPADRSLDSVDWVTQWQVSVLARETSMSDSVASSPLTLSIDTPKIEAELGIDLALLQSSSGKYVTQGGSYTDPKDIAPYDGSYAGTSQRPLVFYSNDVSAPVYVHIEKLSPSSDFTCFPKLLCLGTFDVITSDTNLVSELELNAPTEVGVLTSMATNVYGYLACYAMETRVDCVNADLTVSNLHVSETDEVVRSITAVDQGLLVTSDRMKLSGRFVESTHKFYGSGGYVFEKPHVMSTASSGSNLFVLEFDDALYLRGYGAVNRGGSLVLKRNIFPEKLIDSTGENQLLSDDLQRISLVLTANHEKLFVMIPVKASTGTTDAADQINLLIRIYSEDGTEEATVDYPVPSDWEFHRMLNNEASYSSRVWYSVSEVIVGFLGGVFSVNWGGAMSVTKLTSSFLKSHHFTRTVDGFMSFKSSFAISPVPAHCESGFEMKSVSLKTYDTRRYGSNEQKCAHHCFVSSSCEAYRYESEKCETWNSVVESAVDSMDVCQKLTGTSVTKRLYVENMELANTVKEITFIGVLRGFELAPGVGEAPHGVIGYAAFRTGSSHSNEIAGIQQQTLPYVRRYDNREFVLSNLDDGSNDRASGIDGDKTVEIVSFAGSFSKDSPPSTATSLTSTVTVSGTNVIMVLDLCGGGGFALIDSDSGDDLADYRTESLTTSMCDEEYFVIRKSGLDLTIFQVGQAKSDVTTDNSAVNLELNAKAKLVKLEKIPTNAFSDAEARALTFPSNQPSQVNVTSEWQHFRRTLPGWAVRDMAKPSPIQINIDGGREEQRSVALDALQMYPLLSVGNAEKIDDILLLHVKIWQENQLETLGLSVALTGDNMNGDWKRMHVTVGVDTEDRCRVSLGEINDEGTLLSGDTSLHSARLAELGCTTQNGQCQLEVPFSLASANTMQWVGLKVSLSETCGATAAYAWLPPLTTIWECNKGFFWSESAESCLECDADSELSGDSTCGDGQYVSGCAALINLADGQNCIDCPNKAQQDSASFNEWTPGIACSLQCMDGYHGDGITCNLCSASKESECRLKPLDPETERGYRRQSCSRTQDEQCVLCDPIEKSIFSDNEEFVVDVGYECQTTCKPGFYRELHEPYYCRPCTDLATLQAEVDVIREDNTFYRFHGCTKFANARFEACQLVCDECDSANQYEASPCTTSQNRVCNPCKQCGAGEFKSRACSQFENAECQPCGTCGAGETLLEACSESTDITCQPCPSGTFKIAPGNEGCTNCQPDCAEGAIELISCTSTSDRECQTCSFCGAGQFRESGCVDAVCTDCPTGKFMASTEHTNHACDVCDVCGEDSYASAPCTITTQTSCASCPLNSGSPADSQDITACQCRPGYTGSDGGACAACADGKFKSATGSASCTECNAISCDANFYQDGCGLDSDGCIACPDGTESSAGSTSIEQCLCSLGTEKRSPQAEGESYCVECAAGKYRDNLSDLTCTQCADAHATTILTGSASASACVCDRGYVGSGSSCSACLQGRYKDVVGADACSDCHDYATSLTASTSWLDCTCLSGYQRYGDFISPSLPAGNDFDASRDKCCMVCEAGKYLDACTESFAGNCVSCGEGRTTVNSGAHSEELCVCAAGYRHTAPDSDECVICSPGTYNQHLGMQTCSNCDAGKYGEHEGADEPEDCTVCGLNQYCTEGVGSPENCPPSNNPYSWTGSTSLSDCCPDCQLGEHYTDLDVNCDCSLCPDGKEAPTRPAYDSAACQDCGAGKFRSTASQGSSGCESCQAGKFSTANGAISESTCQSCPANSVSLAGSSVITACECDKGYTGPDGGTCQACAQGKYKESTGSQHCTGCIAACMCLSGQSHCVCDTTSLFSPEATSDSSACECAAGFAYEQEIEHAGNFFSCISCEEGKSKNAPSKTGCTTCPEGKYSDTRGALTCTDCGEGLTSPAGSTSSSDCRILTYEYARGLGESRMCYTDQIWPSTTSNHALGRDASFVAPTLLHCWNSCVSTFTAFFGVNINNIFWDEDTQDCKCQIDCKCLVTGQYDTSTSTYIVSRDNTLPDICQCSPGTTGPDGSIPDSSYSGCTECSAGTYKASFGSAACDSCNENQTAPAGSTDISACECQLGYEFFTPPCDCDTGNPFLSACDCPGEYCSPCPLGHHKNITGNSSCFACPAGKISDTTGTINCTSCPEGSEAVIDPEFGATSCDNPCGPGYEGPDDQCTACNPGHFKDGYGSGPCTQCPAGKFSSASGSANCNSCAANSASADGATECTACTRGQTFKVASVYTTYACTEGGDNRCIEVGDVFRRSNDYRFVGDHTYDHLSTHYNLEIYNTYGMWWLHPSTDSAPYGAICSFSSSSISAPASDTWLSWHSCMTLLDSCEEQIIF